MAVDGEGCVKDRAGCVQIVTYTKGLVTNYLNGKACTITNPPAVPISVTFFAVEPKGPDQATCQYDYLTVNGARYCGTVSPEGVVPDGSPIEWHADGSETEAGWKLCFPPTPLPCPPEAILC